MNEIITKLNEIEEKAETILCDARARKEELSLQLEQEKREMDATQQRKEQEILQQLREQLTAEAEQKIAKLQDENRRASEEFDVRFAREKEQLADEIMQRVIK